jgi:hypothetical protein
MCGLLYMNVCSGTFIVGVINIDILQCLTPRYLRYLFIRLFYGCVLLFVWPLPFDLSGMSDATKTLRSRLHSSPGRWGAETSLP